MDRTDDPLRALGHQLHFGDRRLRRFPERPHLVHGLVGAAGLRARSAPGEVGSALVSVPMRSPSERGRRGTTP